jgi:hypothetical protein
MNFWEETIGVLKGVGLMVFVFMPVGLLVLALFSGGAWAVLSAGAVSFDWALQQVGVPEANVMTVMGTVAVMGFVGLLVLALSHDLKRW